MVIIDRKELMPQIPEADAIDQLSGGIRLHRRNNHGPYRIDVFSEDAFVRNQVALTDLVVAIAQSELGWSEDNARAVYEKALKVDDPEEESLIPSVMVFRKDGVVAGASAQRLKYIHTHVAGMVPVLYHILRGIEPEFRAEGMGRDSIAEARYLHRKAKYYAARNGSPVPVWATMQADREKDIFVPGTSHPWERFYDHDESDRVYQQLMAELHMDIRTNGRGASWTTGVSIADYPEYNRSYLPNPEHDPTNELLRRMEGKKIREGELGMVIKRGDSVLTVIKIKEQ